VFREKAPQTRVCGAFEWWARLGSNQRPPQCQCGALPLSYAPGLSWTDESTFTPGRRPAWSRSKTEQAAGRPPSLGSTTGAAIDRPDSAKARKAVRHVIGVRRVIRGALPVRMGGMKRDAFLAHVGWTGAGVVMALGADGFFSPVGAQPAKGPSFVQISDSHIGFSLPANKDVVGTFNDAIDRINALDPQPAFVIHTGDITHLSKAEEFDTAHSIMGRLKVPLFTIPGEHDAIGDEGRKRYLASFGRPGSGDGWFSFDNNGAHFVSLVNVFNFETMGVLGTAQLGWLQKDLAAQKPDTPVVVFGHVPLWELYPKWGWTTEDGAKAIAMLRKFNAATVLNGHIHQVITMTDGNIHFATADATAYPQPAPGQGAGPGPLTLPAPELAKAIGYRTVSFDGPRAVVADRTFA
jgi:3',5'-cyclic-AMP phosphodiesterase